jgi:phenylacetate-coenzyme A ligase PaaK-like adenylate-forming protein
LRDLADHVVEVVRHVERGVDAAAAPRLAHSIKATIGISAEVRIGAVERSIGKAKRVIDKRLKS